MPVAENWGVNLQHESEWEISGAGPKYIGEVPRTRRKSWKEGDKD